MAICQWDSKSTVWAAEFSTLVEGLGGAQKILDVSNEIADEFRKAFDSPFGPTIHESYVLTVDVTVLRHSVAERVEEVTVGG